MKYFPILILPYILLTAVTLGINSISCAEVVSSLWQVEKTQHFMVYYQEAPHGYIKALADKAEKYYGGIVEKLGYTRFDFWNWDNRAKIYMYSNLEDYQKENQRNSWSGAFVSVRGRVIKSFVGQQKFMDSILPHEIAHIVFREFIGLKKDLPLWFDEGVACVHEESILKYRLAALRKFLEQGQSLGLEELSAIKDTEKISPELFYSEAASLVNFLLTKYGTNGFLDFSRELKNGADWKDALRKAYNFQTLKEMESRWKQYIMENSL